MTTLWTLLGIIPWIIVFIHVRYLGLAPIMMAMMGAEMVAKVMPIILTISFNEKILFGISVGIIVLITSKNNINMTNLIIVP